MPSWTSTLVAIFVAVLPIPLCADTITLKDGRKLTGKIREAGPDTYRIILRQGSLEVPRADVVSIEEGPIPEEVYRDRARDLADDDLEGHLALARWCRKEGLDREFRWEMGRVLEIDPDHAEAREALGYVRHEERWITEEEHKALTRHPWVPEMRRRLETTKVDLDHVRQPLAAIVVDLAHRSRETIRLEGLSRREKLKMTYKCKGRPVSMVLEDLRKSVRDLDYVLAEDGVVLTSRKGAARLRNKYGMPRRKEPMGEKEVRAGLASRHLTLLFVDKDLPWVLRYLETMSGFAIVMESRVPEGLISYRCTAKPLGEILDDILRPRRLRIEIVGPAIVVRPGGS
jgi:hypothetical protein